MRVRDFETARGFELKKITWPARRTEFSAGYDLAAYGDYELIPMQVVKIATGLKCYMAVDEFLGIHIRSSLAVKQNIILINAQGIIDSDYYNNQDNDGHIIICVMNIGGEVIKIKHGERIAQGIFYKYLKTDNDVSLGAKRLSGIGSTDK